MRKPLLLAGIAVLLTLQSNSQLLNWASSFNPLWNNTVTAGTAPNVAGSGITSSVNISLSGGSYTYPNGLFGTMTPTVTGSTIVVPGSSSCMQIAMNFANNTNTCTITYTFTSQVTNVSFRIVDIDKLSPTSYSYVDKITVTGSNGAATAIPTITKYDAVTDPNFLIISGNTVIANPVSGMGDNTDSDAADQRGAVTVSFGSSTVKTITIVYTNHSSAQTNPGVQFIGIGNLSFSASTLPVSLSAFNGHRQTQNVVLDWKTQQETNTLSYDIERNSGSTWETIGNVAARGNSTVTSNYNYTDVNPQGNILLYRLKQIDIDNNFKYSNVIRILGSDIKTTISSYPNPFTEVINVSINSPANQQVSAAIFDAAGKTVRSEMKNIYQGNNNFSLTGLTNLSRGIYYVEIKDEAGSLLGKTQLLKN